MDYKTIELELLKINEDFINYLDQVNLELANNIDKILEELKIKVDDKSTFIKSLEAKLIALDNEYNEKYTIYQNDLTTILNETQNDKYNIEDAKVELEKQKEEELKPFFQSQKKLRAEIASKITSLRKELTFLQKENKNKLIEEEKNYKNREVEYTRKMDIDLTRASEANIKQYSELEKSILDTEDVRFIKETQKKINSIRLVGIKENLEIKNKYAVLNYENSLAFKKFQEKVELDNLILTEEFKQRIRSLEYELELLDLVEEEKIGLLDYSNELKLKEFERENALAQCSFSEVKANKYSKVNNEYLSLKTSENSQKYELLSQINNEISSFDLSQVGKHLEENKKSINKNQEITNRLIESLKQYINSFKELIIVSYNDFASKRKDLILELTNILSSGQVNEVFGIKSSYGEVLELVRKDVEDYLKVLSQETTKFNNIVKGLVRNLENCIRITVSSLNDFWKTSQESNLKFYNKINQSINSNIIDKSDLIRNEINARKQKIQEETNSNKEDYNKKIIEIKEKTKKILNDFNIKKKELIKKIDFFKNNIKLKKDRKKKELNKYIKQSKAKILEYKKIYGDKISSHEKIEYKNYREIVNQNKQEYKNRLESLNVKK